MEEEKNIQGTEQNNNNVEQNQPETNLEQNKEVQEVKQEQVQENNETSKEAPKQEYKTFEPLKQEHSKKKSKKGGIIAFLILLIVLAGALVYHYYSTIYTNPQQIYKTVIKDGVNALVGTEEEATTVKSKVKLDVDLDLEDEIQKDIEKIIDLINDIQLELEVQVDSEKQQLLYRIDSDYKNEELLKMNMLIDAKKEKLYMQLEQFFKDTLEVEVDDDESFEAIREAFETETLTIGQEISKAKIVKILNEEISSIIKEEYCSKEQEKITISSNEINTDKYVLKMTSTQLVDEITRVVENLKNNEEYLECYEDKKEVEDQLEAIIEELEDIETSDEETIAIKLYRKGIKQETVRVEIELEDEEGKYIIRVEKTGEIYKIKFLNNGKTYISGEIQKQEIDQNNSKINIKLDIKEIGKIELDMECSYAIGEAIDTMEIEKAVNIKELTQQDYMDAYKKIEDSKLYELIEEYSKLFGDTEEDIDYNDYLNDNEDIEDDVLDDGSANQVTDTIVAGENEVIAYDGTKIAFKIQNGFKISYDSNTYKRFSKQDISLSVSTYYKSQEQYFNLVNELKDEYEEDESFKNVKISEEKTIEVNGKTFSYLELSYEYETLPYNEIYICTEINDTEVYAVEVEASNYTILKKLGIEGFLTIEY